MAKAQKKEAAEKKSEIKSERIAELRKKLDKDFGKGTLMGATQKPTFHDYIPTGSVGLDAAIGIGGLPRGRVIEVYGPESSGKTTLCLEVIAQAHKNPGSYCAIIDAEHAMDTAYARNLGIDLNRLEISQPDWGEQALEVADKVISSGDFDIVVIDSVAALVPKNELDNPMGAASVGSQARLMSQALRKLTASVAKTNTMCIFINQMREKIGVMFGSPETTTGGNALKFYASVRLDVRRSVTAENSVMNGDEKIGNQTTVRVIKNKVAPPFKKAEFDILYGEGIDEYGEVLDMAVDLGMVEKSGTWYNYNGDSLGQGRKAAREFLKSEEGCEIYQELRMSVTHRFTPVEFKPTAKELDAVEKSE